MSNRLAGQGSPYLLQHASNPVDWYPWGEEAIEAARREDKPIFLSIGYSACHWCHVMAHESFEDPEIARLLNEQFISIKVDREEHPEVDQLYMESIQMMTGQGGWPLSVFLTPHLEPFFGGTYWPPQSRGRMLGFRDILIAVNEIWKFRRGEAVRQGTQLIEWLKKSEVGDPAAGKEQIGLWLIQNAYTVLSRLFDPHFGGFGPAPKFPHPGALRLLLRWWRRLGEEPVRNLVTVTLDHMAAGGIYDHVGGGFHRYSTDAQWLVPHFEKMLYDNALLAGCYLEAWQATGRSDYARLVHETLDYLLRDLVGPEGGFASSEDADSDRREGAFYLWTLDELRTTLGDEAVQTLAAVYDVTEEGNFEGRNLLARSRPLDVAATRLAHNPETLRIEIADILRRLREVRARRPRPARDEKILVNWNALAVDTLAQAGMALGQSHYIDAAQATTEFLLERLLRGRRLFHCWSRSETAVDGFLDDYAALGSALFSLYEARFNERWIDVAMGLADEILARFFDPDQGRFFFTSADAPLVPVRKVDVFDNPTPSGAGLAIGLLLRLGRLCGRNDYLEAAHNALAASVEIMRQSPIGAGQLLLALDAYLGPMPQLVLLGRMDQPETADVLSSLRRRYLPNRLVAFREDGPDGRRAAALDAAFQGKQNSRPGPTLWLCEQFRCQAPVSGKDAILKTLASLSEPAQMAARG